MLLGVLLGLGSAVSVHWSQLRWLLIFEVTGNVNKTCSGSFYRLFCGVMVRMRRVESPLKVQWRVLVWIEGLSRYSSQFVFIVDEFSLGKLVFDFRGLCFIQLLALGGTCYLAGSWLRKGRHCHFSLCVIFCLI
ncbi:hypothetical protein Bca4012_020118 [Brassica carinata]